MEIIILYLISFAQAHMGDDYYGHHMMDGYGGFGGGVAMLLFWIILIVGVVYLIRYLIQNARDTRQNKSALDILKERYAKGEIDKEEFERRKKDLD